MLYCSLVQCRKTVLRSIITTFWHENFKNNILLFMDCLPRLQYLPVKLDLWFVTSYSIWPLISSNLIKRVALMEDLCAETAKTTSELELEKKCINHVCTEPKNNIFARRKVWIKYGSSELCYELYRVAFQQFQPLVNFLLSLSIRSFLCTHNFYPRSKEILNLASHCLRYLTASKRTIGPPDDMGNLY